MRALETGAAVRPELTVRFSNAAATIAAHAFAAQLASSHGIRAISIKGPVAEHYHLRRPRASADADIWIEPKRFEEFCRLLEERGWHRRVGRKMPSLLPPHASTYIKAGWPCDLDVHRTFSGFFADPADAFEGLWKRRAVLVLAHHKVTIPSLAGAAVVGMLHAIRNPWSVRSAEEYERISSSVVEEFSMRDRDEFYAVAKEGGSVWVLREFITQVGLGPLVTDADESQRRVWSLYRRYAGDGSTIGWWEHLRRAKVRDRPGVLLRALWVSRADVPRNDPANVPGKREAWFYQVKRWQRGLAAMAHYVRRRGAA